MQLGDNLRMQLSEKQVVSIDRDVLDIEVLELRLRDTKGSLFAGLPGTPLHDFVEVCGTLAPLDGTFVEILRFQRFERFREIMGRSEELAACRAQLEEAGYDVDLSSAGLGPGKILWYV